MAKLSLKPWQYVVIAPIVLFIVFFIYYGIQEMTKLPPSPLGVPAQTDPYEYNWELEKETTAIALHGGNNKKSLTTFELNIYSNNIYNRNGVNSETMYSELYDIDGNLVAKLMSADGFNPSGFERWQLPASMHLTYYTFFEGQFYQLDAKLPREAFKKAFDETFLDFAPPNLRVEDPAFNNTIVFKFAPEGRVLVFVINANNTSRRIVARYQAKKIQGSYVMDLLFDPNAMMINRDANGDFYYPYDGNPYHELITKETHGYTVDYAERIKRDAPPYYEMVKAGKGVPEGFGKWMDDIQIKYPWKLEVIDPTGDWLGEYTVSYISDEWDTVLRDRLPEQVYALKPVPSNLRTWVYDKPTGQRYFLEIDTYARIKNSWTRHTVMYKDPNIDYLRKRFEYFFPNRTLADNDKPVKPEDFATLKIILDTNGKMSEIYLEKNGVKLPLDGAYHYYLAPVQEDGYWPQEGFDEYITEPKVDLTNPELSSME